MRKIFIVFALLFLAPLSQAAEEPQDEHAPPTHAHTPPPASKKKHACHTRGKAEQTVQIAAVVNDKIITTKDLEERIRMLVRTPLENIPPSELPKIQREILRQMIDEKLQLEICENAKITITDSDVDDAIQYMEKQNNLEPGSIKKELTDKGISKNTLRDHFGAKIAWSRLIGYYRDTIDVGQQDLKTQLRKKDIEETQYLLGEIVVDFESILEEENAREKINHVLGRLQNGDHFSQVAYEMSHSPSAATGGDIGWIRESQLEEPIKKMIHTMKPGKISSPIKAGNAFKVVLLRNIQHANKRAATITARQLEIKLDPKLSEKQRREEQKRLNGLFLTLEGCDQFDKAGEQLESDLHIYKDVSLPELSEDLQEAIKTLPVGRASSGYLNEDSIIYFMVCSRSIEKVQSVSREEKTDDIVNQRLSSFAEQKLRDIRRVAAIDVRV